MSSETYNGERITSQTIDRNLKTGNWIIDNTVSSDFPIYTRGNVGEVFPDVVKPFSWSLWGMPYGEKGWREALANIGAFDLDEFPSDETAVLGVFGGYCYLNVTASRIFGVRAPGLTPEAIDMSFFGEAADVPPYAPKPTDVSPKHEKQLADTIGYVLTTDALPELDDMQAKVKALRNDRPDLEKMSEQDLLKRTRNITREYWAPYWTRHIMATYHSMIPAGAIQTICAAIGQPQLAADILVSDRAVDSALPAKALWKLSRDIRNSQHLTKKFSDSSADIISDIEKDDHEDCKSFISNWHSFLKEYGFRGPNEWEMASEVWEINPKAPLAALKSQCQSPEHDSPDAKKALRDAARKKAISQIEDILQADPETLGQFQLAAKSCSVFFAGRERSRANTAMIVHEMRMPMYEIGRRFAEQGLFEKPQDFALLTNSEWDEALNNPESVKDIIKQRKIQEAKLAALIPPFIVNETIPEISSWNSRDNNLETLKSGDVLTGQGGCAGVVRGIARIVTDPSDPGDLEPGDILVAPHTDPSWTPIFAAVSGVVVNVGAAISHAVIVARELGVPCVVSAEGATQKIPQGAEVEINGATGTITLI